MAGLYDDLPEPASSTPAAASAPNAGSAAIAQRLGALAPAPRPSASGASQLLHTLDEANFHAVLGFLPLPDVGASLPVASRLALWLRNVWLPWQQLLAPLRRQVDVHVVRLLNPRLQSMEELSVLATSIESAALSGFRGLRHSRLLGGVGGYMYFYGGLPMQRVLWSLHSEGLTPWRGVCSMAVDAHFALLPPWALAKRRTLLPERVQLLVGISLWLPPDGVDAEHSFPALYLNVALADAAAFEALAAEHPSLPPCISATCEAVLFRPGTCSAGVMEEWNLRFCFGPEGYRHPGHGETDGYGIEAFAVGRRRWRPPNVCECLDGQRPRDAGLHLLLRGRRCDGLLD